ncbi:MAG: dihydrofolate reductase family protein [Thaumarchaeota archaeon]|nr:dihydrofolate reductase family protein [Nitrososphaerota archaeon]
MRHLILDTIVSLDGYFTSLRNEIDWFGFDDDEWKWSRDINRRVDTMLYGRVTYEEFRQFWPTTAPKSMGVDPTLIQQLNTLQKVVFSRTLAKASWKPATLVRGNPSEAVSKLKRQNGKDIVVVGSGTLVGSLLREDLIDEYYVRVRPIILGSGRPIFVDPDGRHPLKLISAKTFKSGVVGLHYEPLAQTRDRK